MEAKESFKEVREAFKETNEVIRSFQIVPPSPSPFVSQATQNHEEEDDFVSHEMEKKITCAGYHKWKGDPKGVVKKKRTTKCKSHHKRPKKAKNGVTEN